MPMNIPSTPLKMDVWSIVRYSLIAVGTAIATRAVGKTGQMPIDSVDIETIAGALTALLSAAWGVYVRWGSRAVPTEVAARADVPVQSSATGIVKIGPGV